MNSNLKKATIFVLAFYVLLLSPVLVLAQGLNTKGLFGSVEFKVGSLETLHKWRDVLGKIDKEEAYFNSCDKDLKSCKNEHLSAWREFLAQAKFKPKDQLLKEVNKFINTWPYIEDAKNWKKSDYWASPIEFLDKSGDCEDYAIIKYVTLKELGFKSENMRIVVVMDKLRLINHAILVVYDNNNQAVVLDSLFDAVLPQQRILQYTPHYSVNEHAHWAHVMPIKD